MPFFYLVNFLVNLIISSALWITIAASISHIVNSRNVYLAGAHDSFMWILLAQKFQFLRHHIQINLLDASTTIVREWCFLQVKVLLLFCFFFIEFKTLITSYFKGSVFLEVCLLEAQDVDLNFCQQIFLLYFYFIPIAGYSIPLHSSAAWQAAFGVSLHLLYFGQKAILWSFRHHKAAWWALHSQWMDYVEVQNPPQYLHGWGPHE